jgi:hypothetical protein
MEPASSVGRPCGFRVSAPTKGVTTHRYFRGADFRFCERDHGLRDLVLPEPWNS